jgi:rubrerythrin
MEKTIKNLVAAFVGESQARNRYTMYAKIAKQEGFEQIADIFAQTADQEREHAKWLMRMINQLKETAENKEELNEIKLENAGVPTILSKTEENLQAAINGETYEYTEMYPGFAEEAKEEGLDDIADRLSAIANAEKHHQERYTKLIEAVKANSVFEKAEEQEWVCRKCGHVHKGTTPPEKCPSCEHPKAYFELKCETY